ncbi:Asp-tRNA(Asn)/Glu-tRNA(Gln) amidotransferase subunit GatC [Spiroplasma endosymbiont of Othius punctulatus]|uniref:Asp-tRNA(Asn)/Glu-tRNA(Gln) amidotransferase subunit GatC n=1 Tax=Spiroplasma endosymbiont of Othius punctulatus TaxID=3066289 RepID=UPI0030CA9540
MEINKELVIALANDLKISLNDKEVNEIVKSEIELRTRMQKIVDYKIEGEIEPLNFPFVIENSYLRDDEDVTTITIDQGLKNAKVVEDNYVILPRVVK